MAGWHRGPIGKSLALSAGIAMCGLVIAACSGPSAAAGQSGVRAGDRLASFSSDADLIAFFKKRRAAEKARYAPPPPPPPPPSPASPSLPTVSVPAPVPAMPNQDVKLQGTTRTEDFISSLPQSKAANGKSDSITNNQEEAVDEGDIVKKRGDLLVILRRGRLFTVSIAGGQLHPVDMINAYPPGVDGSDDWYDEMLLTGDRVIVIGYSYGRGGTEINRFRLSPDGHLGFEDAYHVRSNDYYSSRTYASRLIGTHLIYYTPLYLDWDEDPEAIFPGVRRWTGDAKGPFKRIGGGRQTYIVPKLKSDADSELDTLHTVMDCDVATRELDCKATAVIGPESRNFYVSGSAVYLWVSDAWGWDDKKHRGANSFVYRMPFRDEEPSAIAARGDPTDQFSFREDRANGLLDVLVRDDSGGDAMWSPEVTDGDVALLSIPISRFGDGSDEVPLNRYRALPNPGKDAWNFQNRFVGNFILYGGGQFGDKKTTPVFAVGLRGGPIRKIDLEHAVERIDALGRDAVVVGSDPRDALGFSAIDLSERAARIGDVFLLPAASQGESRSHGFFFRPDNDDGSNGLLGLPISHSVAPAYQRFFGSAASMLFLKRAAKKFGNAGELDSNLDGIADDGCVASCVDWYGNARPIFADGRVFALLGYELVEGRMAEGRIREIGRLNFAPPQKATRR